MTINILQKVQQNLEYPALLKVDANTQEVVNGHNSRAEEPFSQAAIPAIIIALYEYSRTDEGAKRILNGGITDNWLLLIFNDHTSKAIEKVSSYSKRPFDKTLANMNAIANECIRIIKEQVGSEGTILHVKELLANQRIEVLPYLPASMQMGELLNDATLDDRTNKMEGPISTLMHIIGNGLSGSDVKEEKSS